MVVNKKIRRSRHLTVILLVCMLLLAGCKKDKGETLQPVEPTDSVLQEEQQKPEEKPSVQEPVSEPEEETHEGEVRSRLTGLWIPEEYENSRPYAIMINNIEQAYPQSGLQEAGILYEVLAEGGITRLMGVFDYVSGDRIGSVRSARHYYVTLAEEYDAIFVHFGQTKYAQSQMDKLGTDNLNGLLGEGETVFFRDDSIQAPHNAFATAEGILKATGNKGYRTELEEGKEDHFQFSLDTGIALNGSDSMPAGKITLPFSSYDKPYLSYDGEKNIYYRYGYGTQHVDAVTKEPLEFTTVLVQLVNEYNIDKNGYQTMDLENSSGKGYYLTGGKAAPIWWSKGNASDATMYYYDEARTQKIVLNPGKIYIAVFPSYQADQIVIE